MGQGPGLRSRALVRGSKPPQKFGAPYRRGGRCARQGETGPGGPYLSTTASGFNPAVHRPAATPPFQPGMRQDGGKMKAHARLAGFACLPSLPRLAGLVFPVLPDFSCLSCRIWPAPNQAAPACPGQARYRTSPGSRGLISIGSVAGPHPLLNGLRPYEQLTEKRCPAAFPFGSGSNYQRSDVCQRRKSRLQQTPSRSIPLP